MATDAEIQDILDRGEAGLSPVFAAYERSLSAYLPAASVPQPQIVVSNNTVAAR